MPRRARVAAAASLAGLLAACLPAGLDLPILSGGEGATDRTPPPVVGGFGGDLGRSPTPPPATATAQPTLPPSTARAVEVTILAGGLPITEDGKPKTTITLNRLPRVGATPIFDTTRQLAVSVLMSNGTYVQTADWRSTRPDTASVDANGVVSAGGATGSADIVATSKDGQASASARVTLADDGAADVVVD